MTGAMVLAGASGAMLGAGTGLLLVLRFARPSLTERLADPAPITSASPSSATAGRLASIGRVGAPLLATLGMPTARTRRRLGVCERDTASYLAEKAGGVLLGVLVPPLLGGVLALAGTDVWRPVWLGLWAVLGMVLWFAPDLALRSHAENRREELRHAVAGFASLTAIALAGGAGVNSAVDEASTASTSWPLTRIRAALRRAAIRREPAWQALSELGQRHDVAEFAELAASMRLAGQDGARVRASLAAKAQTLRTNHLAQQEARANSATERMSLPVVCLFTAFLLLVGCPAVAQILTTL